MSFPPWNPYGNFITSDPNGLPVDRRPLRLGLYLQNQTFSNLYAQNGNRLLTKFKYFRNMGWAANAIFVLAGTIAITPEILDFHTNAGIITGGITALGATGVKFWSKINTDETCAEMETEFNKLKENILTHNLDNLEKKIVVPYLADPSLSERLAEAQIAQTNAKSSDTLSNIPNNVATAGIMLEGLKIIKGLRKN